MEALNFLVALFFEAGPLISQVDLEFNLYLRMSQSPRCSYFHFSNARIINVCVLSRLATFFCFYTDSHYVLFYVLGTFYVNQAGLEFRDLPASVSRVLKLKACATMTSPG